MRQIITSVLDTDLYKLTMQQAVLELFPNAVVEYRFKNRGEQRFTPSFLAELRKQIDNMSIRLSTKEYSWLKQEIPFFKPSYLEYLKNYQFNPRQVIVSLSSDGDLILDIHGLWRDTILWEVPLMALISELYFQMIDNGEDSESDKSLNVQRDKATAKIQRVHESNLDIKFADFGTRRRRSFSTQYEVIKAFLDFQADIPLTEKAPFVGTSNVLMAMLFGIKCIGTMAHEWLMGMSVLEGLRNANYYALHNWVRVYNSDLGIALTDTFGSRAFFRNFNIRLAKLYDGVRHDSGDPYDFTNSVVSHYKNFGIDPMSKVIVFSDGLDIDTMLQIANFCRGRIKCSFGIGTHLTNDFDTPALNMVIKMWSCESIPVMKLSDVDGKVMGDDDAVRVAQWVFNNRPLCD